MISVITPVWNRSQLTDKYLFQHWQIYRHAMSDIEWIIIDNGSTDNTPGVLLHWARYLDDHLVIHRNPENRGFPVACNQGSVIAKGEILVFLNNDVFIAGDYLSVILAELTSLDPSFKSANWPIRKLVGAEKYTVNTGWNVFGDQLIEYIPGWCLACVKESFEKLGGFDERYLPCDYEDMDLSYNAKTQGWMLKKIPLPLIHTSGQSGSQMPNRRAITERNRIKFAEKWGLA